MLRSFDYSYPTAGNCPSIARVDDLPLYGIVIDPQPISLETIEYFLHPNRQPLFKYLKWAWRHVVAQWKVDWAAFNRRRIQS